MADTVYLDHAGTTPYPRSSVDVFSKDLKQNLFGNPHSNSPSSKLSTTRIDSARKRLLAFFKADPEHFDLVFVANATAAIKLVVDCVDDYSRSQPSPGFWYGYHADSHTSLVGVRAVASCSAYFASDESVESWLDGVDIRATTDAEKVGLFAYPGQSNMNGRRLPLSWSARLRQSPYAMHRNTFTLLDAAALASTSQLDMSHHETAPDFTAVSLYKIFGFPDLGALLVRKASSHLLRKRRYFGGGTVDMIINATDEKNTWHANKNSTEERLEDGTPPFHNIIALESALTIHERLYGSMSNVSGYTCALSKALYDRMKVLYHRNGNPLCKIYAGSCPAYGDKTKQGPTIAFNLMDKAGKWMGKSEVEQLAIARGIQLRAGGVCNPGGIATSLELSPVHMRENFDEGLRCGNGIDVLHGKPTGIVRVSLGAMSSMQDVEAFLSFLKTFVSGQEAIRETSVPKIAPTRHGQTSIAVKLGMKSYNIVYIDEKEEVMSYVDHVPYLGGTGTFKSALKADAQLEMMVRSYRRVKGRSLAWLLPLFQDKATFV
ncbi:uncharacterized protein KY384_006574 [Bacidia gigantensis]|uniref:uncharacterized protein n=1 Tax=Bacidia gigantensis TaxID=2732470 RepID=UPI001D04AC97|nr:uncharacterized protein KY384_006574 [Bacidia gigantensis]KAG8528885.1 hypothetical protein KY384_006574 [Bacidia gigantensis]